MFFKKGSLNLSINAIVVLILAVTLLSLGLTFINSTFGGATNELQKALGGISEDRITQLKQKCDDSGCLEFSTMKIKRNNEEKNLLVLNNRLDCDDFEQGGIHVYIAGSSSDTTMGNECQKLGASASSTNCGDVSIQTFSPQPVGRKEKVVVPLLIKPGNNADLTTYRYPIEISGLCHISQGVITKKLFLDIEVE